MIIKTGYKIYNNSISKKSIKNLAFGFSNICNIVKPRLVKKNNFFFENKRLNNSLINLRKKNKKKFSQIYDLMQYSDIVKKFCYYNGLNEIACRILKCNEEDLFLRTQFRIDVPSDNRNTFNWHQDSAYDKLNSVPRNGLIFWIPLINVDQSNGSLIIKPKSHVEKNHYLTKVKFGLKYKSPQLVVPQNKLKKYKSKQIEIKKGDQVVTYANLFHKSGNNSSRFIRFTIIARYNNICKKDFKLFQN
tara:strand:+ start:2980 stop:3717 length:738 start_codon:yes stop_codon:yes gene_type:complete